ncbi:HAMP domain-containing protein [Listeria aquatica]|uniref:histidine kinase n=1 Tax=Listeria aquatica TaxID=1494960 RepID=A0A841ZRE2_9LIST|nr:ATP-binding protein [Listeria aquatica]MBC1521992.1 HAMP domain-containing protein [Listeria aquatica]
MRTRFLVTFLGSLFVSLAAIFAVFMLIFYAINGEIATPAKFYKMMTQQKTISKNEQDALIAFRSIAKHDPNDLLKPEIQKEIKKYERQNLAIVIRKNEEIVYSSKDLVLKSLKVHAPSFDTDNIFTQGTIDNKGNLFRYLKFDFHFKDQENGSVMILKRESSLSEFLQKWGFLFSAMIVIVAFLLILWLNRSLRQTIINPLQELSRKVQQLKSGKLDEKLEISSKAKGEVADLAKEFEQLRSALNTANQENRKYEKNRKELLSNISHDLKTPITSIMGYVEGLRDGVARTPEKQLSYLNMIHSQAQNMNYLIDDLFTFSKLDLHKLPFDFEVANLRKFLVHFADEYQLDLEQQGIELVVDVDALQDTLVRFDGQKIRRVLANLLQNSSKYLQQEKRIYLYAKIQGREAQIVIQDHGSGIPQDKLALIFERFYRVESSRNRDTGGSGLGLAISKQIIAEHGGRIWAESKLGEFTRISFTLKLEEGE